MHLPAYLLIMTVSQILLERRVIMFCSHCGNQIPDDSVFCGHCGAPASGNQAPTAPAPQIPYQQYAPAAPYQQPAYHAPAGVPAAPQRSSTDILRTVFGIALIVSGLIPYLFLTSVSTALSRMLVQFSAYGDISVALVSALTAVFNIADTLLRFPACMLAILTGIVLLQNRWKPKAAAITCAVFNLLYALLTLLTALLVQVMPQAVLSLYLSNTDAVELLYRFGLQQIIWQHTLPQLFLSLAVAGLCFGFLFCKVQPRHVYRDRSVSNLYILVPFLGLLRLFLNLLPITLTGVFMGNEALSGWSSATGAVNGQIGQSYLWLLLALVAVCLVFRKLPFGWTALAAAGVAIVTGVAGYLGVRSRILEQGIPADAVAYALQFSNTFLWGNTMMMAAFFVWIVAITRNCVPLWLQWVLSCAIVPVYVLSEVFCCAALAMGAGMGQFVCAGVILLATLLAGFLGAGKAKQMQYA